MQPGYYYSVTAFRFLLFPASFLKGLMLPEMPRRRKRSIPVLRTTSLNPATHRNPVLHAQSRLPKAGAAMIDAKAHLDQSSGHLPR
jgi:hypothetical protein